MRWANHVSDIFITGRLTGGGGAWVPLHVLDHALVYAHAGLDAARAAAVQSNNAATVVGSNPEDLVILWRRKTATLARVIGTLLLPVLPGVGDGSDADMVLLYLDRVLHALTEIGGAFAQ